MRLYFYLIFVLLAISLLFVSAQQGCNGTQTQNGIPPENNTVDNDGNINQGTVREFTMIARQWEFVPDTITVNEGDTVRLTIESTDVAHGFAMPQFNVNERLEPGQVTLVQFVAGRQGTFTFFCSVQCGTGHPNMRGTLIVQ